MNSFSPAANGLRVAFRRPAITLAEIAWRWSFVAAAWILGLLLLFEYMDSLPVHRVDRLLLRTNQPVLIARAIRRIFQGSAFRFTEAGALLAIGLAIGWIVLASLGRVATVEAVLEEFGLSQPSGNRRVLRALMRLNVLRVSVTSCAVVAAIGAMLISNSLWASTHISAGDASILFFFMLLLIWTAWVLLNWFFSLATISAVAEGKPSLAASGAALHLCERKPGAILITSFVFGLAHIAAFVSASVVGFMLLAPMGSVPQLVLLAQALLIAAYCAFANWLYTARMAAYVSIIRAEDIPSFATRNPASPVTPSASEWSSIDRDELILSDAPLPAS
jgi:hypothetical protein